MLIPAHFDYILIFQQIDKHRNTLKEQRLRLKIVKAFKTKAEIQKKAINDLLRQLRKEGSEKEFLDLMNDMAVELGVGIEKMDFKRERGEYFVKFDIYMKVSGQYARIKKFISELEALPRPLAITKLKIEKVYQNTQLDIVLGLTTYFAQEKELTLKYGDSYYKSELATFKKLKRNYRHYSLIDNIFRPLPGEIISKSTKIAKPIKPPVSDFVKKTAKMMKEDLELLYSFKYGGGLSEKIVFLKKKDSNKFIQASTGSYIYKKKVLVKDITKFFVILKAVRTGVEYRLKRF